MGQEDLATVPEPDEGQHGEDKTTLLCPSCGSKLTRRSMRRSWQDRLKAMFGSWPYRCQMCSMRFTGPKDQEAILRFNEDVGEELHRRAEETRNENEDLDDDLEEERHQAPAKDSSHEPHEK